MGLSALGMARGWSPDARVDTTILVEIVSKHPPWQGALAMLGVSQTQATRCCEAQVISLPREQPSMSGAQTLDR